MNLKERLGKWAPHLGKEFSRARAGALKKVHKKAQARGYEIGPGKQDRFSAFGLSDPEKVHTVLLGDGCFPGGNGLVFSSKGGWYAGQLRQALQECMEGSGQEFSDGLWDPSLDNWPIKGILPLPTSFTYAYKKGDRRSFLGAWSWLVEAAIKVLVRSDRPVAFILTDESSWRYLDVLSPSDKRVAIKTGDIHRARAEGDPWAHKLCFFSAFYFVRAHGIDHPGYSCLPF